MSCDQCQEREAVIHLTQIVERSGHDAPPVRALRGGEGGGEPGRRSPRRRWAASSRPWARNAEQAPAPRTGRRPAPAAADRCRTSGRAGRLGAPTAIAPSRRRCGTCCGGCTAPPSTRASATPTGDGAAGEPADRGGRSCGSSFAVAVETRELRAGRRAAGPAPGAGMIDLSLLHRRRASAGSTPAGPTSHLVLSTRIRLARNLAGHVFQCRNAETEREDDPRGRGAGGSRDVAAAAGHAGSGSTGWTGPTGSCCTSGTW